MQFGVIHLKTWGSTQPYVALVCFWRNMHGTEFSFIA